MLDYRTHARQNPGSAHRFCQDRFRIFQDEDRLILVAADGHGGRPYTRSGLGARFSCTAAEKLLKTNLAPADFPAALKDCYDAMVAKHLAFHPLEDWEVARVGAQNHHVVYGATFLAVVITPKSTTLFQLGDGEIHALKADGSFLPPLPPDTDCHGNITTSLAHSRDFALRHFRMARYEEPAAAVMMYTDGCEGGLSHAAAGLVDLECLDCCMEDTLRRTNHGDDQTFLLSYNRGIVDTESFQVNLAGLLETMKTEAHRRRQLLRDREEYQRLRIYLNLAVRKAKRLADQGDPGLQKYLSSLRPKYERFWELHAVFGATQRS